MPNQSHLQGILCERADINMSRLFDSIAIVLVQQPALIIIICEDKRVNAASFSSLHTLQKDEGQRTKEKLFRVYS